MLESVHLAVFGLVLLQNSFVRCHFVRGTVQAVPELLLRRNDYWRVRLVLFVVNLMVLIIPVLVDLLNSFDLFDLFDWRFVFLLLWVFVLNRLIICLIVVSFLLLFVFIFLFYCLILHNCFSFPLESLIHLVLHRL